MNIGYVCASMPITVGIFLMVMAFFVPKDFHIGKTSEAAARFLAGIIFFGLGLLVLFFVYQPPISWME